MISFVCDANILMSILISGKACYRTILAYYDFILPEFGLVEIEKHKKVLQSKTRLQESEFLRWSYFVFSQLTILPQYVLSRESLEKSRMLLENIDLKDATYVALAMQQIYFC